MRTLIVAAAFSIIASPHAAAGDADDGRVLYQTECAHCHFDAELPLQSDVDLGARLIPVMMATYGPKLIGIVGRVAGSDPAFLYSETFSEATQGVIWTEKVLDEFLADSQAMIPRSRMYYSQPDRDIRRKVLAYLKTTG